MKTALNGLSLEHYITKRLSIILKELALTEDTKLLEKHNIEIRRATAKYKHTHTAFVDAFNKELAKLLFKPMDAHELQDPEKVSTIWVKNLNKAVKKMNNTISSMIGMKPKNAIKLDTIPLDKTSKRNRTTRGWPLQIPLLTWRTTWRPKPMSNRPHLEHKYVSTRSNCTKPR